MLLSFQILCIEQLFVIAMVEKRKTTWFNGCGVGTVMVGTYPNNFGDALRQRRSHVSKLGQLTISTLIDVIILKQ